MSDVAVRQAIDHNDADVWAPFEQAQNHLAIGCNTRKLYLDGVTLKLSAGMIGLYNGSQYYNISNSVARTISIAALTASLWAKLELSVVAGVVTTTISSIAGANNPAVLPASFTGSFDPTKGGYYETATKRIVGLAWINAAGAVEGIVNTIGGVDAYTGSQLNTDAEYVFAKSVNYTILNYEPYAVGEYSKIIRILMTAGANGTIVTLGAVADNVGRIIRINRVDDGTGCTTIYPPLGVTISDMAYVFMFEKNDYVELYCDGTTYRVLHASLTMQTGGINTNDWTNREIADAAIPYDGALGTALVIGEKVTEAISGNTGIIVYKTATVLTLKKVTGTGIFTDDRVLTGSMGVGTVVVNIPGSTSKNADSSFYHGYGINDGKINYKLKLYNGTTYVADGAHEIRSIYDGASGVSSFNYDIIQVDVNNSKVQTGANALTWLSDATGAVTAVDTEDWSYNLIATITF